MQTYVCIAAQGLLSAAKKGAIAIAITRTHEEVTDAPAYFAHVTQGVIIKGSHNQGVRLLDV